MDDQLPEQEIEAAESRPSNHDHDDLPATDLSDHLQQAHGLDPPDHLSQTTLDGLHDRLHQETDAADDPDGGA